MDSNNFSVWDKPKLLAVLNAMKEIPSYWLPMFANQYNSNDEKIYFDKLPYRADVLAPIVSPLAAGEPIWRQRSESYAFTPAYVKPKDPISPLEPLMRTPGIDSMYGENTLTPAQRLDLLRLQKASMQVNSIRRRFEWLACRAIVDGKVTIEGEQYPTALVDFHRDPSNTVVLTPGTYWGDSGVNIFDSIQQYVDKLQDADFGGVVTRITLGYKACAAFRASKEFKEHMDTTYREPRATVERGLLYPKKVTKVGELTLGGNSGNTIEVFRYNDTFDIGNGTQKPFIEPTDAIFTCSSDDLKGFRCFGSIIDMASGYESVEIYPRNWVEGGDPIVEYIMHQSAPLMVPLNPNTTLKLTAVPA